MNRIWLRRTGPIVAALLLALVVASLQVPPARADLSTGDGAIGEMLTETPQNPPPKDRSGSGSGDDLPPSNGVADPDEFSVNSPHNNGPAVDTVPVPVRLNWTLVLRAWLVNLAMIYLIRRV